MKTILCAATLAATLGITADALAAAGDPTGTGFGVSGTNYGDIFVDFGVDLLFEHEYTIADDNFTGDAQLGLGGGTAVGLTFDGSAETINGLEFNESYQTWPGGAVLGHNSGLGPTSASPITVPSWDTPSHLIELSIRDTLGNVNSGGGVNRDIFQSGIVRFDDINPDSTTPSGDPAIVLFPNDRHPTQNDPLTGLDGNATGFYFYYELNGAPANPAADINIPVGILQGDHPTKGASQQVYFAVYSDDQLDLDVTHDIEAGVGFGINSDTFRELGDDPIPFNLVSLADALFFDGFEDIDTIVFGQIYKMIAEGDGDSNGKVDGLDYLRWASNFGTTPVNVPIMESDGDLVPIQEAPSTDSRLDFKRFYGDYDNSGGPVDGLDYLAWAANFGFVGDGSGPPATTVPEPGTLALACFGLAGMGLSVRRRRQS